MAAISVLGTFLQLITYYFSAIEVPGWASLFAAVTLIGGIQLFFLGVGGEYITLIFDEVKQRPRYILDRHYRNGQLALVQSGFATDYQAYEARENSEKRSYEQPHHSG